MATKKTTTQEPLPLVMSKEKPPNDDPPISNEANPYEYKVFIGLAVDIARYLGEAKKAWEVLHFDVEKGTLYALCRREK